MACNAEAVEHFIALAAAHFVALLIPGSDFFVIARAAIVGGGRYAVANCLGIACGNGVYIAAALSGLAFVSHSVVMLVVQTGGGVFLLCLSVTFLRAQAVPLSVGAAREVRSRWLVRAGHGLGSALSNPKNGLFYVSIASLAAGAPPIILAGYGAWMVTVVLLWDVALAFALGSVRKSAWLERLVPWMVRGAGVVLGVLGVVLLARVLGVIS